MVPDTEDPIIAARGMLKGTGVLKAYLKEKEKERKMEEKKLPGLNSIVLKSLKKKKISQLDG